MNPHHENLQTALYAAAAQTPEALAERICRDFNRRSGLAFLSEPTETKQKFIGVMRGEATWGAITFDSDELPSARDALIQAICRRRCKVADIGGTGHLLEHTRRILGSDAAADKALGREMSPSLKLAVIRLWNRQPPERP